MVIKQNFVSDNNIETPSTIVVIPRPQDLEESGIKIGTTYIWIWPTYSFADMEILLRIGTINTYTRYKLVYIFAREFIIYLPLQKYMMPMCAKRSLCVWPKKYTTHPIFTVHILRIVGSTFVLPCILSTVWSHNRFLYTMQ